MVLTYALYGIVGLSLPIRMLRVIFDTRVRASAADLRQRRIYVISTVCLTLGMSAIGVTVLLLSPPKGRRYFQLVSATPVAACSCGIDVSSNGSRVHPAFLPLHAFRPSTLLSCG